MQTAHIEAVIKILNKYEIWDGEKDITLEDVTSNPKLLKYLSAGQDDPLEHWNADGYSDWRLQLLFGYEEKA